MKKYISVFFAVALVFAIMLSTVGCSSLFKEDEPTTEQPDKSVVDNETADLLAFYESLLKYIRTVQPSTSVSRSIDAKDIKFYDKGAEESDSKYDVLNSAAGQGKKYIFTDIKNIEIENNQSEYGSGINNVLQDLSVAGFKAAIDKAAYGLTETSETQPDTGDPVMEDNLKKIIITLADVTYPAPEGSLLDKLFDFFNTGEILDEFSKTKEYLEIGAFEDFDIVYSDCTITVELDRKTDQVSKITLVKNAEVVAPITGAGELSSYGEMDIKFRFVDTTTYSFNWTDPNATETEAE